jgi:WD40 repeat protein
MEVDGTLQTVNPLTLNYEPVPITLPETSEHRYLAFNYDMTQATYLVDTPIQETVRLYNFELATGEMEVNLDAVGTWDSFFVAGTVGVTDFPADNLAWSSNGQIAISGYFLALYTPEDDALRLLIPESEALIHHIEWSPDGHYLAVVIGNTVEIWDATTDERVEAIYTNTETNTNRNPYALAWHPDGNRLVVSLVIGPELLSLDVSHLYEEQ